jgi:anaerobic ribonucleoside-triphosphate reductase activating protein
VTPEELVAELAAAGPLDGLTLSGGEPFDQAAALDEFLDVVAGAALPPLSVIAFCGYTLEELRAGPPEWSRLLARVDLLIDGLYREEFAAAAKPLTGSANQRRVPLTTVGERLLELVGSGPVGEVQVQITAAGEVLISGFPSPDLLRQLQSDLPED